MYCYAVKQMTYSQDRSSVTPWWFDYYFEKFPYDVSNSNQNSCMCNEQWIFYENFSVFGKIENLWMEIF